MSDISTKYDHRASELARELQEPGFSQLEFQYLLILMILLHNIVFIIRKKLVPELTEVFQDLKFKVFSVHIQASCLLKSSQVLQINTWGRRAICHCYFSRSLLAKFGKISSSSPQAFISQAFKLWAEGSTVSRLGHEDKDAAGSPNDGGGCNGDMAADVLLIRELYSILTSASQFRHAHPSITDSTALAAAEVEQCRPKSTWEFQICRVLDPAVGMVLIIVKSQKKIVRGSNQSPAGLAISFRPASWAAAGLIIWLESEGATEWEYNDAWHVTQFVQNSDVQGSRDRNLQDGFSLQAHSALNGRL
ncbi:hypothetical protein C8R45DRAFT_921095 [Mycena sanguinolenta]|nr:hypothetical protein C8R45DRAFT_921095 [Mycena sanguinolenta]